MRCIPIISQGVEAAGFLGIWAACYAAGCVIFVSRLLEIPIQPFALLIAMFTTTGVYLLDRIGPWPAPPDRGDLASVPRRVHFLRRRVPLARWLAAACLVAAMILAGQQNWFACFVIPAAVFGMTCYGHVPRGQRLKQILVIKNMAVGVAFAAMSGVLVWTDEVRLSLSLGKVLVVCAVLALHVVAGAMLCDLDDAESDARQGIRTVPNTIGIKATWSAAALLVVIASLLVDMVSQCGHQGVRYGLAILPAVAFCVLWVWRPAKVRDLVDLSFPLAVVASLLVR